MTAKPDQMKCCIISAVHQFILREKKSNIYVHVTAHHEVTNKIHVMYYS